MARAGHLWWGATVIGLVAATGLPFRLIAEGSEPVGQAALDVLFDVSLMVVLLLLGQALRSRLALREEAELRLRLGRRRSNRSGPRDVRRWPTCAAPSPHCGRDIEAEQRERVVVPTSTPSSARRLHRQRY